MLATIFALLSATFYGLESGITKVLSDVKISYIVFVRAVISLIFSIFLLFFFFNKVNINPIGIVYTIAIAIVFYAGLYLYLKSLSKGSAGVMMSINSSKLIIVALSSYVFFNHTFSVNNIISIVVIVLGMLFVGIDSISTKKVVTIDGLKEGLLSVLVGGIASALAKIPISMIGVYLYAVIIQTLFLVFSYLLAKKDIENNGFKEVVSKNIKIMTLIGLSASLGFFFFNQALYYGDPSLVNGIMTGQIIVASLFEYIFLKKTLGIYKYLGILLVFVGIFTLAYYW